MLTFHATGDWPPDRVRCRAVPDSRPTLPDVTTLIDRAWAEASRRPGVHLFDGPMVRLESWRVSPPALELDVSRTSYKIFLGTNLSHPELADGYPQFGRRVLANPVGVSPSLVTADGFLMMGRRNGSVAYYPNRIHPFAGAADPADAPAGAAGDSPCDGPDVFASVRRELSEELGLGPADLGDIRCTGIAEDQRIRQPELIFRVECRRTRRQIEAGLDAGEHDAAWAIPATAGAVEASLQDVEAMTPVAVAALLLWGRATFGGGWFDRQRMRLPGARVVSA